MPDLGPKVRDEHEGVSCVVYAEFPILWRRPRQVTTRGLEQLAGSRIRRGRQRFDRKSKRDLCLARDTHFAADQHLYFSAEAH